MKETIFEEGVASEASLSDGFGPSFVRMMVDRYGGDVRFEDRETGDDGVDTGAVAVLELPIAGDGQ